MTRTALFRAALAAASVSAAVLATACTAAPTAPPSLSAPLSTSIAPTAVRAPSTAPSGSAPSSAARQPAEVANAGLKFPGKTLEVRFTSYDRASGFAEFHLVTTEATGGGPHVVDVPGLHRLRLTPTATIEAIDPEGFPFETCPPDECSTGIELESVLSQYGGSLFAHASVNADDLITDIHESAY
ncbi:hypothetical protein VSH64_06455 [Amycolatopsis rhabdoformis]|uniref:Lipoprotein n=1 Tax=Amycolatopsis rhabdoformis TaxID=1448059 RepID=A0ABZ1IC14_9PSEU|nr:hypothetical protein [Amycolatopsis rhabdoformis]WSE31747.1 hypothetical protein VSH64_06455 [Amycolatopsis rhabdoformis]